MSSAHTIPSQIPTNRADMLAVFREHLIELFQMPAEQALERINRELGANPLTSDMQLQLRPDDRR
jgi:hypothetical protein